MTNTPPPPSPDIIQAMTAMRSHEATLEREIVRDEAEIADKKSWIEEKKVELAKARKGLRAIEEIFGPLTEEISTAAKTSRRTGASRVAVEECPLALARRQEIGEKYRALYAIAEAMPNREVHTRTTAKWLIEAGLMPDQIDNARVALTSYLKLRPSIWEPGERGFFRLITPQSERGFLGLITPQTEAESATQETGGEMPEADPESDDIRPFNV